MNPDDLLADRLTGHEWEKWSRDDDPLLVPGPWPGGCQLEQEPFVDLDADIRDIDRLPNRYVP